MVKARLVQNNRTPGFHGSTRGGVVHYGSSAFPKNLRIAVENQRVYFELVGSGDAQSEARIFVRHGSLQTGADGGKQLANAEFGYERVGDFEQDLQPITL